MAVLRATVYFLICFTLDRVYGHGMMLDPPNRSSLWRFNKSFPANYNDNENFCGGMGVSNKKTKQPIVMINRNQ